MKTLFLAVLAAVILLPSSSKAQNLATNIKVGAMDMGRALTSNDFNSFIKYVHPKAIELGGGRENMKSKMDTAYKAMQQFGASFKRYSVGHPGEIVEHKKQLQALLPQALTVKSPWGEITTETTLIAFSNDKGKTWTFFDAMLVPNDKLKTTLPDLSPRLKVPPRKKPAIKPAEGVKLPGGKGER